MSTKRFRPDVDAPDWKGGQRPLRHHQRGRHRPRRRRPVDARAGGRLRLARRAGDHDQDRGPTRHPSTSPRTPSVSSTRPRRPRRTARPTTTPSSARSSVPCQPGQVGRRPDPGQHRHGLRPRSLEVPPPSSPAQRRPADVDVRVLSRAHHVGQRATRRRRRTCDRRPTRWSCRVQGTGPVPVMMDSLLSMARSGALDQALVTQNGFYTTDYTLAPALLGGRELPRRNRRAINTSRAPVGNDERDRELPRSGLALALHLLVPDPAVLSSGNADILVWGTHDGAHRWGSLLVPFIPGLRSIPRKTKVYRLIWRDHYQGRV